MPNILNWLIEFGVKLGLHTMQKSDSVLMLFFLQFTVWAVRVSCFCSAIDQVTDRSATPLASVMDCAISEQKPSHALNRVAATAADNSTQRQISHTYWAHSVFNCNVVDVLKFVHLFCMLRQWVGIVDAESQQQVKASPRCVQKKLFTLKICLNLFSASLEVTG